MSVRHATIIQKGEPAAGIHDVRGRADLGVEIEDDDGPEREYVRECLRQCWGEILDGNVKVVFDDECATCLRRDGAHAAGCPELMSG